MTAGGKKAQGASGTRTGLLVLGNQLFDPAHLHGHRIGRVFMREDAELCTYYRFHKQKLVFFLAAMRCHAQALEQAGLEVHYEPLDTQGQTYEERLLAWIVRENIGQVRHFEVEDKFFARRIEAALRRQGVAVEVLRSPMFLTDRASFAGYLAEVKRPFMKTFYERQRRRLGLLLTTAGQPVGGRWSYDDLNRQALPKHVRIPDLGTPRQRPEVKTVAALVEAQFPDHPGAALPCWLPVDRAGARRWLRRFLDERLHDFGPYEDALSPRADVLFHSVLTPFLNCGLLTPQEVIQAALDRQQQEAPPLPSLEGFIRQIVGWREFIRGIYQNYSDVQESKDFWGHTRGLSDPWYQGGTGIPPLDAVIDKVGRLGWAHHIERLMVVGNLMLLLEVAPKAAHRWFMEMFVDSSDWVMGPNVYGMALHSDGGIFATKPYICGSNYYRKMGGYSRGDWCDGVDGLYWRFIERNRAFFSTNPRLAMMARSVAKMAPERRTRIYAAADALQARLTTT